MQCPFSGDAPEWYYREGIYVYGCRYREGEAYSVLYCILAILILIFYSLHACRF